MLPKLHVVLESLASYEDARLSFLTGELPDSKQVQADMPIMREVATRGVSSLRKKTFPPFSA